MQINKTTQNNEILLSVSGRIDSTNAQELIEACAQVEFDKIEKLVMDFADVTYISSAGLRSLLVIRKKAGAGKFFVANVNSDNFPTKKEAWIWIEKIFQGIFDIIYYYFCRAFCRRSSKDHKTPSVISVPLFADDADN